MSAQDTQADHLPKILSFLQKLEKWPQDSGLTRTYIKSSVSPANIQNFIQSITFALEKQPQQPDAEFLTRLLESPLFIT